MFIYLAHISLSLSQFLNQFIVVFIGINLRQLSHTSHDTKVAFGFSVYELRLRFFFFRSVDGHFGSLSGKEEPSNMDRKELANR